MQVLPVNHSLADSTGGRQRARRPLLFLGHCEGQVTWARLSAPAGVVQAAGPRARPLKLPRRRLECPRR
jgi:hypothetical protein